MVPCEVFRKCDRLQDQMHNQCQQHEKLHKSEMEKVQFVHLSPECYLEQI